MGINRIFRKITRLMPAALFIAGCFAFTVSADEPDSVQEDGVIEITEEEYTISQSGIYHLQEGLGSGITIEAGADNVTVIGNGVEYNGDASSDEYGAVSSTPNSVAIDASACPGITLTLKDLYISNDPAAGFINSSNNINFSGSGNTLIIEGTVLNEMDYGFTSSHDACIHVGTGTDLTISGPGTYYQYNNSQGAGIGGDTGEVNGEIVFDMTGYAFIKGTKQGAVIGAGAGTSAVSETPGSITFESGVYNIVTNSRGAAIGGSAGSAGGSEGTTVNLKKNATVSVNTDYSGAAVGGGGYKDGNDSSGGNLVVYGGSIRPYVDTNAANNAVSGWHGKTLTEGVNDAVITANRINGEGQSVYMCVVDLEGVEKDPDGNYKVIVDNGEAEFYEGVGHSYIYAYEDIDRESPGGAITIDPLSTISNWLPQSDGHLYLYLTGEDHTVDINGTAKTYTFSDSDGTFKETTGMTAAVFRITPADAGITVTPGTGYTYTEEKMPVVKTGGDDPETVVYVDEDEELKESRGDAYAGTIYTATIVKDGYYASEFSFSLKDGVISSPSANVRKYLDDSTGNTFVISLTEFIPSENEGAWDGKTIDVSWYSEDADEMEIRTPAQLMGMAAIVNGIYNAEITAVIDSVEGGTKTFTPDEYAAYDGRKIRPASSSSDTSGPDGSNQISSSTYWFGVMSDGITPSDFAGRTVKITADLDMGGYLKDAEASDRKNRWSGARFMTIGGQSPMHYIDFGAYYSDAFSILGASFNGTLDGEGHVIKNIYCERYVTGDNFGDSQAVGIIGRLGNHDNDPAEKAVKNPAVRNIASHGYISGRRSVGGIVGKTGKTLAAYGGDRLKDGPVIENCVNFSEVYNTDAKGAGGIAGAAWNYGIIKSCVNFGYVYTGYDKNGGGIAGSNESAIINSYNAGFVDGMMNAAQAIGSHNGGVGGLTNVYWLTGSSMGDTNTQADETRRIRYSAYWDYNATRDDLHEVTSFEDLKTRNFLEDINGTSRAWAFAADGDSISSYLSGVVFKNVKLETAGVNASGMPVPAVFTGNRAEITGIEKTSDPEKTEYIEGQSFDDKGLEIWAYYDDGSKELLEDYTVSPSGALSETDTKVTVSGVKDGMEYSFDIPLSVTPRVVNSISFQKKPDNLLYAKGETFDPAGMSVRAYYSDRPADPVILDPDEYTWSLEDSTLTVSYTYKDKTVTTAADVTFLESEAPAQDDEGTYLIGSSDELRWFANRVNALSLTDINGKVTADFTADPEFEGIGSAGKNYCGSFDGDGHVITLQMDNGTRAAGLVAYASDAEIKNITVDGSVETGYVTGAGGIVGYTFILPALKDNGAVLVLENCVNRAGITAKGYIGGIIGNASTIPVSIKGCINEGTVTSTEINQNYRYAGGIAGYIGGGCSVIEGCLNYGAIDDKAYYSSGNSAGIGGIAGYIKGENSTERTAVIRNCGNEGDVSGFANTGGIAGQAGNYTTIERCYNTGNVSAFRIMNQTGAGGIAGLFSGSAVTDVYVQGDTVVTGNALAAVASKAGAGGIVGRVTADPALTNAYLSGDVDPGSDERVKPASVYGLVSRNNCSVNNMYISDGASQLPVFNGDSDRIVLSKDDTHEVTEDGLKSLAASLGDKFTDNTDPEYHKGYTILLWENGGAGQEDETASVTLDKGSASVTVKKTLTLKATADPADSEIEWISSNAKIATVDKNGKVTGVKQGRAVITAKIKDTDVSASCDVRVLFSDVPADHSFAKAVYWAADNGITGGYTGAKEGLFGIRDSVERGQVVTFLWRMAGSPAPKNTTKQVFKDVPIKHSFYKAIQWAYEQGIAAGYKNGNFGVKDNCTRGQIAMFLWRYAGKPAPEKNTQTFKDVPVKHSFYKAVQWGKEQGIIGGYTGSKAGLFGVNDNCTRGQMVTFLYRATV